MMSLTHALQWNLLHYPIHPDSSSTFYNGLLTYPTALDPRPTCTFSHPQPRFFLTQGHKFLNPITILHSLYLKGKLQTPEQWDSGISNCIISATLSLQQKPFLSFQFCSAFYNLYPLDRWDIPAQLYSSPTPIDHLKALLFSFFYCLFCNPVNYFIMVL